MEAGKDLVPLLLSALALGSLLLWNFLIGRLAYWTGAEQYSSLGIASVVAWHVALVLSLLSLSLLGWRLNSLRGVWIVCAVMAVLDAVLCGMRLGIADFHWLELGAASLLIGIRYGIGFACWIVFCGGWSGLSLLKAGAGALLVTGGAYGAIDLLGMADAPLVPFAFGCLTVASLVLLSRYWSDAGARREVVTRGFAEAKLPSLVLVALLALAMQMVTVTLPQLSEWGISTVVAGAMLFVLVALKAKVVADDVAAYFFIVGLVSALIGVILVFDWSHSRIAQIASMTIFWLLFILLFVVFCNKNGTLAGFSSLRLSLLYVVVMYSSLTAGLPLAHFLSSTGVANGLVAASLLVICSLLIVIRMVLPPKGRKTEMSGSSDIEGFAQAYHLAEREVEVLGFLIKGYTLNAIADELCLSPNTIKTYRTNLYRKLGVSSKQGLVDKFYDEQR